MNVRFHRRELLRKAAITAGAATGASLFGVPAILAQKSPNSTLGTVVIGCVNQGIASVNAAASERLIALVDVDDSHLEKAKKFLGDKHPDVKATGIQTYFDYRKMFDEIHKQVDAVFVAAPDHHHAPAAMIAIKLGKGVYVEKPLAHSIEEVRTLTAAARKYQVVTQMGNQGHSGEGIRRLCEYIWAGAIGDVTETYSWAPTGRGGVGGRLPTRPVPPGLHWDEWIGPAHNRDYHEQLHPKVWRSWWEFGDGSVGDWGCHNLDGPFMALKLGVPESVEVLEQVGGSDERFPLINTIRWTFPARGEMPAVKVHWFDGYRGGLDPNADDKDEEKLELAQNRPPIVAELEKQYGRKLRNGGTIYVGTKGIMHTGNYAGGPRIIPEEKHQAFPLPEKVLPRIAKGASGVGNHQADFLRACKEGGAPPASHFDYSGPLTEVVLLGCMAIKAGVGKKVQWDAAAMQCPNLPELNRLVKREYRPGWTL